MSRVIGAFTRHRTTVLAASLLGVLALGAQPLAAQTDACALLKAADVSALLGSTATPTPSAKGTSCGWKGTDPKRRLAVLSYSSQTPGEMAYAGAHQGAAKDPDTKLVEEAGIGDKAFSVTPAFGVSFVMLKHGRVLQVMFYVGGPGTPADRDALRAVARKAIAAF